MLQELVHNYAVELIVLPAALVALLVVAALGCFTPTVFDHVPRRRTGLQPVDLLVAFVMLVVAGQFAGFALDLVGVPLGQGQPSPSQAVLTALAGQVLIQLPVAAYAVFRAARRRFGIRRFGLLPRHTGRELGSAGSALVVAVPMVLGMNVVTGLISQWFGVEPPPFGHQMLESLSQAKEAWVVAVMLASSLVLAPLLEEITFRGLVQTTLLEALGRRRRWAVVLLAAAIFAAVHAGAAASHTLPGLFVLGLVLGWLYERTGSLLPSVIVHMGFNTVMVAATLASPQPPQHDVLATIAACVL